jgi:SAM-dependent methyltransferase
MTDPTWIWEILACPECGGVLTAGETQNLDCTQPTCGYRCEFQGRQFNLLPKVRDHHEQAENDFRVKIHDSMQQKFPSLSPQALLRLHLYNRITYYAFSSNYLFIRDEFTPRYALKGRGLELGGAAGHSSGFIRFFYPGTQMITSDVAPFNVRAAEALADLVDFNTDYFITANAEKLPFQPGSFDFIFSSGMLHHIGDLPRALLQGWRVLKPGGRWYIINELAIDGLPRWFWNSRFGLKGKQAIQTGVRENSYSLAEWNQFFDQAGLRVVETRFIRNPKYKMESWPRAAYYALLGHLPVGLIRLGLPCEVNFVLEKPATV